MPQKRRAPAQHGLPASLDSLQRYALRAGQFYMGEEVFNCLGGGWKTFFLAAKKTKGLSNYIYI